MSAEPLHYNGVECLQCRREFATMRNYLNHRNTCDGREDPA